MAQDIALSLSRVMRKARENAGLSQDGVAILVGVTRAAVGNWETKATTPQIDSLIKFGNAVNISAWQLLKEATT